MEKTKFQEIAAYTADVNGITKRSAENILQDAMKFIADELKSGKEVTLPGIGKLFPKTVAARSAMNLQTYQKMQVPEHTAIKFKVAAALKDAVK